MAKARGACINQCPVSPLQCVKTSSAEEPTEGARGRASGKGPGRTHSAPVGPREAIAIPASNDWQGEYVDDKA
jgi:hypothetical protein